MSVNNINNIIKQIMLNDGVTKYDINFEGNTLKGDGYLGEIAFVTVNTNLKKKYNFVIKTAKESDALRETTPVQLAYEREIHIYKNIFPRLEKFQKEKNIKRPFYPAPKMYFSRNETKKETLVLKNIKEMGYTLWDRKKVINLDHALAVFKNYGKWHALTLSFQKHHPEEFSALTSNMKGVMYQFFTISHMDQLMEMRYEHFVEILRHKYENDLAEKFMKMKNDLLKYVIALPDKGDPVVLVHGDCWVNNMMFLYGGSDRSTPTDMYFLDFQLSYVTSPILDLSYFLYATGDQTIFRHFDFLLQAYHSSLCTFASELGTNAEDIFTFEQLKEQWKKFGMFGVLMSTVVVKMELSDEDEALDLVGTAEGDGDFAKALTTPIKNEQIFEQRVLDVLVHFGENFL